MNLNKNDQPKISILMNCYNGEKYLKEALDSIQKQTYQNWEVIFIDNNSKDASQEIAKSYGEKVKIYPTPRMMKLYEARHFGLPFCKGDYLAVLDVDDYWHPQKLELQLKSAQTGKDFIFTDFEDLHEIKTSLYPLYQLSSKLRKVIKEQKSYSAEEMLRKYDFNLQTVLIKKDLIKNINFDPEYDIIGDLDFFLQIVLEEGIEPFYLKDITAVTRVHPRQLSHSAPEKWIKEFNYLLNKISSVASPNIQKALADIKKYHELTEKIEDGRRVTLREAFQIDINSPSRLFLFFRSLRTML